MTLKTYLADKDTMLTLVQKDGRNLEYVSEVLKNDKEVVLAAIKQNGTAFKFASDDLKNDKEVVLSAVNRVGLNLEFASAKLKNDKDVVLTAVAQNGLSLQYASNELTNNKKVVLAAINNNVGSNLEFASVALKNENEVVLTALKKNADLLIHASDSLKNNKEFILECVKYNGRSLEYASYELRNDKDVVLAAVEQNGCALMFASDILKSKKKIVLAAVKQNKKAIFYASIDLQKDNEFILESNANNNYISKLKYKSRQRYICAIVKDEQLYIEHWLEHHYAKGIDKAFIYNHGITNYNLSKYGNCIEIIEWHPKEEMGNPQVLAYNHFLENHREGTCLFIDIDEYLYGELPKNGNTVLEDISYDSNGHFFYCQQPVTERFTREAIVHMTCNLKTYSDLSNPGTFFSSHRTNAKLHDVDGRLILDQTISYPTSRSAYLRHYITKSLEEYKIKLLRGSITKGLRTMEYFYRVNPEMKSI
ncbi:MAG: DUF4116 domain-containing protein [Bacteroidetes bacterium]|nr:DUF4116 domain-containing protein [Bacteroidota bacterium]